MSAKLSNSLPVGTRLDSGIRQYVVVSVLGAGGFGITYRVKGRIGNAQCEFAIKEHFIASLCERDEASHSVAYSTPVKMQVEDALKDFITEAERLNNKDVSHPNIVGINEVFKANNTAYYVMEYLPGPSMQKAFAGAAALSEKQALNLMTPVLDAVALLHSNRITHLDLKPDNIILVDDEIEGNSRPVIIDFGLSKHYNPDGSPTSTIRTQGCSDGYAPMEQYLGIATFSPQADVYALAATLYFLITGTRPPIAAEVSPESIRTALSGKCTNRTTDAIVHAMAMNKNDRTQSVGIFAHELGIDLQNHDTHTGTIRTAFISRIDDENTGSESSEQTESKHHGKRQRPTDKSANAKTEPDNNSTSHKRGATWTVVILAAIIIAAIIAFVSLSQSSPESKPEVELCDTDTLPASPVEAEKLSDIPDTLNSEPVQPTAVTDQEPPKNNKTTSDSKKSTSTKKSSSTKKKSSESTSSSKVDRPKKPKQSSDISDSKKDKKPPTKDGMLPPKKIATEKN